MALAVAPRPEVWRTFGGARAEGMAPEIAPRLEVWRVLEELSPSTGEELSLAMKSAAKVEARML